MKVDLCCGRRQREGHARTLAGVARADGLDGIGIAEGEKAREREIPSVETLAKTRGEGRKQGNTVSPAGGDGVEGEWSD